MNAEGIFGPLLGDAEVALILGDRASARAMVEVEIALAKVEGRLGVIDPAAAAKIEAALAEFAPDEADLARGTAAAGVPVPALVAQLRRQVGGEAAGFVHWGATSQDIVDTALVLQLRDALALLGRRLDEVLAVLARLADEHRATPLIGRTRFQQAVPTTFGLKVAGWLVPLLRHRDRLRELRPRLLLVQLGGAAGNLAAIGEQGIAVMTGLAAELGLGCPAMPWHNQRDGLAELASWLSSGHRLAGQARVGCPPARAKRGRRGARGGGRGLVDHAAEVEPDPGRGAGHLGASERDAAGRDARGHGARARARRDLLAA